ncbi:MAG TPA: tripartite tricarboxylate transporter TctB family protein [Candidatus Acidoferrum sp.]|nr:tripartite tricarboxylate transporter TctB family protein [Candidatus Acidoferrum sp.]
MALVSVILAVYACAFPFLGYLVATMLFFPVTYFVFGVRPWLKSAWVGVFTAALFYVIFAHFAEIPLPKGFLELAF